MTNKIRVRVVLTGRVQGVFFRGTARDVAIGLKVNGWVKNRWDRTVELVIEGEEQAVGKMVSWCRQGPAGALVTGITVTKEPFEGTFQTFKVSY